MSETVPEEIPGAPLSEVNPQAAAAVAAKTMEASKEPVPDAPKLDPDIVDLPGGFVTPGGKVIRTARVRELNGYDEEKIFRAWGAENVAHVLSVILECGTAQLGNLSEKETKSYLDALVIGDRESIILAIRCATYDDTVKVEDWTCPECGDPVNIELNLREDIEYVKSPEPASALRFDVPLRKGGRAVVRLPNGEDQEVAGEDARRTVKERASILIQRCVDYVEQPDSTKIVLSAFPNYAKQMSIMDRSKVTEEIAKHQPRPRYDAIKFIHDDCGKEVSLALNLAELFLR